MEAEQLNKIISQGEGTQIEFKKAEDGLPGSFYETAVSFSNTDGGTILLGVLDSGNIVRIDPQKETQLKKDIITTLNNRDTINSPIYVQPFTVSTPEGIVMVVQIPVRSQVHSYNKEIYLREYDVDINITNDQKKIGDIYIKKRNYFTETKIYPHLTLDDLNESAFQKALKLIKNNKSDHPWLELDKFDKEWINWLEIDTTFKEHIISGLKNIYLSPSLNWDEKQPYEGEDLLKVPSFYKKSPQLLKKKNRYFIGILSLCAQPIKSGELLKAFNYKNEKTFRDNYLKPLRESGFIQLTNPQKPTDPNNKYKITEKGAAFLGGIYKQV